MRILRTSPFPGNEALLASGNNTADELASVAAQESWVIATRGQRVPDTDRWDAPRFLIRQRASQARGFHPCDSLVRREAQDGPSENHEMSIRPVRQFALFN